MLPPICFSGFPVRPCTQVLCVVSQIRPQREEFRSCGKRLAKNEGLKE